MKFIKTSEVGRKPIRNNFMYHLNKTLKNYNTNWECDKRCSGSGCKAKVVLDQQNSFLRQSGEHTHASDSEKVLVEKFRSAIKSAPIETMFRWCNQQFSCKATKKGNYDVMVHPQIHVV